MSTFLGCIEEIPGISVDRFDEDNLKSSVFFLSHCHSDHMNGLSYTFFKMIESTNRYIYCSPISKIFLESTYNVHDLCCINEIYINHPIAIEYKDEKGDITVVSVTCIPAGHCPGSVMFLFEKGEKLILYTGDFRINPTDFPKLKYLHCSQNNKLFPKKLSKIYLDTTFLTHEYSYLPTRQECILKINDTIQVWLNKNPRNIVILSCSALYGSEFLYIELSKFLKKKIHVKAKVYESYCRISELAEYITNDSKSTPIHACMGKIYDHILSCRDDIKKENIFIVVPSVLKWSGKDTTVIGEQDEIRERTYNVCYSTHASFNELKAFIKYFNTAEIFPCVIPKNMTEASTRALLHEIHTATSVIPVMKKCKKTSEKELYTLKLPNHKVSSKTDFESLCVSDNDESD